MQNKYIRITKAQNDKSWYKDKIGKAFKLDRENDYFYFIDSPLPSHLCVVNKKCAELIITENRKAKNGEKILITNKKGDTPSYKNGDILTVTHYGVIANTVKEVHNELIVHNEYETVVYMEKSKEESETNPLLHKVFHKAHLKNMDNKELRNLVTDIFDEISTRAYGEGYRQGRFDQEMEQDEKPKTKTDQERRDKIIEQAKRDVEDLINHGMPDAEVDPSKGNNTYQEKIYTVEFLSDSDKRKVTALVKRERDKHPRHVGRAKALPEDCFNVHIGKAIALRRALELEVPEEYFNAPQPTEVHVGDVLTFRRQHEWFNKAHYRVDSITKTKENLTIIKDETGLSPNRTGHKANTNFSFQNWRDALLIIDDSRENE
ncbi:hypothetical protein P9294_gp190 [Bacillus phage FADO]|uniref:Uncharacterized protein n=1 Tax=Bacillus phage FADO TaxID=2917160 RepID=A0AAE9GCA5_9CAUD|nr:hypothetical protein P9294_gp190 [Bacillus phage FADO]UNY48905.1 hypothetical protein fado_190 [Bacillus phage FADO]